jgi:predicted SnoaL-like aldol condensation-catalyzing enzyme
MKRSIFLVLGSFLLATSAAGAPLAATASPPAACAPSSQGNRQLVLDFYKGALLDRKPREAFERYMSEAFVEHKPDVPEGSRAATITFLEGLMKQLPDARWSALRSAAQDDLVFVHATFTPAPGAPAYVIADVFRLDGCRIVEHWDVVAAPKPDMPNPNSRY